MTNNIPDFQTLTLPFLKILGDDQTHTLNEMIEKLSVEFKLTEEEKNILLPSGNQPVISNRIGWTKTYLKKAGLVSSPARAVFKITEEGKKALASKPAKIDVAYLRQFPAFKEWVSSYSTKEEADISESAKQEIVSDKTPAELIDTANKQLLDSLAFDVVERLKTLTDKQFEIIVLEVLKAMGYGSFREGASEHLGKSNDGGIDGLIREDKLGLDTIYVQAKQYRDSTVPIGHIRDFAGSLLHKKAKKGVFITLSSFPHTAYEYVNVVDPKIVLINGKDLAKLMIEYNVGVSTRRQITIKDIDNDFFDEL